MENKTSIIFNFSHKNIFSKYDSFNQLYMFKNQEM